MESLGQSSRPADGGRVTVKVVGGPFGSASRESLVSGRYRFAYDPACADYDWLVVFDELPGTCAGGFEPLRCPRERTILCTWEPVSIKSYSRAYTRQFGHLLTNRPPEAERHPHFHLGRGYFVWFVHDFPKTGGAAEKPLALSAVCSAKQMRRTRHHDRFRLVETLAREIPGMDWFGKGVRPLERKEDALLPYRYHVAVENHIAPRHWTEKLADALLCECLPFYAGDPAIAEALPEECVVPIPLDDPAAAVRIVREAIARDEYSRRREAILEAKRRILGRYNFWHQVIAVIEASEGQPLTPPDPARPERLWARKALRRHSVAAALEDGWSHARRFLGLGPNLV